MFDLFFDLNQTIPFFFLNSISRILKKETTTKKEDTPKPNVKSSLPLNFKKLDLLTPIHPMIQDARRYF